MEAFGGVAGKRGTPGAEKDYRLRLFRHPGLRPAQATGFAFILVSRRPRSLPTDFAGRLRQLGSQ